MRILTKEELYHRCDPDHFSFNTTAELAEIGEMVGQERAVEAVLFGIGIRREGFNLFALGPSGAGKHTLVRGFIADQAAREATPSDWCYINNFTQSTKPLLIELPPGRGRELQKDVDHLIDELRSVLPAAFETESFRTRRQAIDEEIEERHETAFRALGQEAQKKGVALLHTPTGFVLAPVHNDEVLTPEQFEKLPLEEQQQITTVIAELQDQLQAIIRQSPQWRREGYEKIRQLNREVTTFEVDHLIDELRAKYQPLPDVISYLDAIQQDVIDNVDDFIKPPEPALAALMGGSSPSNGKGAFPFRRYMVNLLVAHEPGSGAPVVYEDHPTFPNLIGQVEYLSHLGAMVTDFNLIRPGALHRANGGYLLLDAHKILQQPYAWEGLKRALRSNEIRVESLGQTLGLMNAVSLEPRSIPLAVKVVLIGERSLYYLLCQYDPDFSELFKVAVDFEDEMERTPENHLLYARTIGTIVHKEQLLPLDRAAVARVIEHSSRLVGDSGRLTTNTLRLADLLREADFLAHRAERQTIGSADIQQAIDAQQRRVDRIRARYLEEICRGTILIDTSGRRIGQINGLSVIVLHQFSFGHPTRITARVRLGRGEVIDIEREVSLGGPIHSKGVLILSGFLGARYATDHPLSLSASLVFEQSYGGVEGDSASSAELYALISALAEVPINQSFAVTGSVNQHGEVQAIGGVNEKIEGFFDLCQTRGLTGEQGVLIPESNVRHLMLRHDVVAAVEAEKFHIYPVSTIDEGIEILTGLPAGSRDANGNFPFGSINQRVEVRLVQLAEKRVSLGRSSADVKE
ncbi:MAG: ATP-binding protein [Acidobacteria bacterium]|nr:ATP-binding protein [Acidobacteriota bacterium]